MCYRICSAFPLDILSCDSYRVLRQLSCFALDIMFCAKYLVFRQLSCFALVIMFSAKYPQTSFPRKSCLFWKRVCIFLLMCLKYEKCSKLPLLYLGLEIACLMVVIESMKEPYIVSICSTQRYRLRLGRLRLYVGCLVSRVSTLTLITLMVIAASFQ